MGNRLPPEVFEKELETVVRRRGEAGLDERTPLATAGLEADVARGLVGLAISGGGIRSSTFSLGVIQELEKAGIFLRFDYMSTVSGGGYTGSMLSSLLNEPCAKEEGFSLGKPVGEEEPRALKHLRNGSNYLNPGGSLSSLRLPAMILRGLWLNFLLFLPYVMLAVVATEIVHEQYWRSGLPQIEWRREVLSLLQDKVWAVVLFLPAFVALYLLSRGIGQGGLIRNERNELLFTWILVLLGSIAAAVPFAHLVELAVDTPLRGGDGLIQTIEDEAAMILWVFAAGFGATVGLVVLASRHLSLLASKVVLYLAAIAGPASILGIYLLLCVAQIDSPFLKTESFPFEWERTDLTTELLLDKEDAEGLAPFQAFARALEGRGIHYEEDERSPRAIFGECIEEGGVKAWHIEKPQGRRSGGLGDRACEDPLGLTHREMPLSSYYRFICLGERVEMIGAELGWGTVENPSVAVVVADWAFLIIAVLLLGFNYYLLDVNRSSLHSFYRDRLSRLYLRRRRADGALIPNDSQRLSELNAPHTTAPYHLLNATLNLQGSKDLNLRGRRSDYFVFSKHFCGSLYTGYCSTPDLERRDHHVNLGTAMAISAAAAAPNMGATTMRSLVFAMTLLNLRLGYWLPNPRFVREGRRSWSRPHASYLFREALGNLDVGLPFINVTDGGHLENLGAYELLRRRCRTIVIIDCEADPEMRFSGLINLIRLARIDLGVGIEIDLSKLQLDASSDSSREHWKIGKIDIEIDLSKLELNTSSGCTREHWAIGKLHYGEQGDEGSSGSLLYIKSSLTGDEAPVLQKYRADHPDFPHETTADQFFDEAQFEAYRSLGAHVGSVLIEDLKNSDHGLHDLLGHGPSPAHS